MKLNWHTPEALTGNVYDVTKWSIESTILRSRCHPFEHNAKTAGNSFVYCLADEVKRDKNDIERHEARCMYRRKVPIKLADLDENCRFLHLLGNKTVIPWLFGERDKTTALGTVDS